MKMVRLSIISTKSLDLAFSRYDLVDRSSWYFDHSKGVVYNNFGSEYDFMFGVKLRSRDVVPCKSNKLNYCWFDIDSEEFQLKLLQTYGLFCGSKLKNYIKITSSWTDEEEKGITDILRIIENKTYRINIEKENIY